MFLITGATGNIGKELVKQLSNNGCPIRVLVRDPQKVVHLNSNIQRIVGDLDKPDSLNSALEGVDKVFLVTFETQQDVNMIQSARQFGVKQIVKLSTMEASKPLLLVGRWHREREQLIEDSGIDWTFLRPGMFMSNSIEWWSETIKTQGKIYFPGGKGRVAPVAPSDVAAVALKALTQDGHNRKIYELTGPELLTIDDMAVVIGRLLGKTVQYVNVPLFAARLQMLLFGMDPKLVKGLMQVAAELRSGQSAAINGTIEEVTGHAARTFNDWCLDNIKSFQSPDTP